MAKLDGRTKGALWLLIAPTALLILSFILYAVVNWIFSATTPTPTDSTNLYSDGSIVTTISNIILFLMGVVGVITWLPGIVVGIILLATKK
ncbi:MAG: hypothetical protein JWM52_128 [Candidatus Saccharibacteria bacterium]|nr:hypothetical protein [Candidatus Saccharibacteria bacterium]